MLENIILGLDDIATEALIEELKIIDSRVHLKTLYVQNNSGISRQEALEYVVNDSIALWAKVYLNWTARGYQKEILRVAKSDLKLALRLGRRLGKTDCMCVIILYYAYTQNNAAKENGVYVNKQYKILILTPYETQVDLIFDRLSVLIYGSKVMSSDTRRDINHKFEFKNDTVITGLTLGSSNGKEGASTRGQSADLLIYDEVDYIDSASITNSINVRNEDPGRIKVIVASTPSGRHDEFYKWCVSASTSYAPTKDDIDNFRFTEYIKSTREKGNGWTEIYAPSTVNDKIIEINPDTKQTYLEDIKDELSEARYLQEVMAEFGDEQMGVYKREYIERALELGDAIGVKYTNEYVEEQLNDFLKRFPRGPRILGVDWDLVQATPTLLCVELDKGFVDKSGAPYPIFRVLFREEIKRSEFTMDSAVQRIIDLNAMYNFDYVAADRGYGDVQIELLKKYGKENPASGLHKKTIGYQLGQSVNVIDPYTRVRVKKRLKPFMVNNSCRVFERNRIMLNPDDSVLIRQLSNYRVVSIGNNRIPIYTDKDEHSVDALNLALVCFEQKYGDLMRTVVSSKMVQIDASKLYGSLKGDRALEPSDVKSVRKLGFSSNDGYVVDVMGYGRKKNKRPFKRSYK